MRRWDVSSRPRHSPAAPRKSATHTAGINPAPPACPPSESPRFLIHSPVCHSNSYFYGCSVLIGLLPQHDNSRPSESLTKGARPDINRPWMTPQISRSQKGIHAISQRTDLSLNTRCLCDHAGKKMSGRPGSRPLTLEETHPVGKQEVFPPFGRSLCFHCWPKVPRKHSQLCLFVCKTVSICTCFFF